MTRGWHGHRHVSPLAFRIYEPEKFQRKTWNEKEVAAGYAKFLDDRGWRSKRIAETLQVDIAFVGRVIRLEAYRRVPAIKPPFFVEGG